MLKGAERIAQLYERIDAFNHAIRLLQNDRLRMLSELVAALKEHHPTVFVIRSKEQARWRDFAYAHRSSESVPAVFSTRELAEAALFGQNPERAKLYHVASEPSKQWGDEALLSLDLPYIGELRINFK